MRRPEDTRLSELDFIGSELVERLAGLEIHTLLQLADRLRSAPREMGEYLGLDRAAFRRLIRTTRQAADARHPARLPEIVPGPFVSGVDLSRLDVLDSPPSDSDE